MLGVLALPACLGDRPHGPRQVHVGRHFIVQGANDEYRGLQGEGACVALSGRHLAALALWWPRVGDDVGVPIGVG